ncbi:MAG: radical SAM protein [archaeon]|nr:radical SAM protein [archaeon]
MYYKEPVFRPPSEAYSLLIQATEGCTYRCTFCISNLRKEFKIRSFDEIKKDIDIAKEIYGRNVRKIFFLDGNAMVMPYDQLLEITQYAKEIFPNLERVSVYAHGKDILGKTDEELKILADSGLKMAYIGIETGNDELLKKIGKRQSSQDLVDAFHKLFRAGITPSGTIILGLAGNNKEISKIHMKDTAEFINRASPINILDDLKNRGIFEIPIWYISCLALMIPPGTPIYKKKIKKLFEPMNSKEILEEMRILIENISQNVKNCIFRSNHASNFLAIKGMLSNDKEEILNLIDRNLIDGKDIRPEYFRAL